VLTGPSGSGKTHLASAIANRSIENGMIVFFSHAPDLLDHLRSTYGPTSEVSYTDLFDQVREVPMLVLDGLGSQSTTPWAEEKLRQILNHRHNAELPTVVTTSADLADLDAYIAARLGSSLSTVLTIGHAKTSVEHGLGRVPAAMLERMTFDTFNVRQAKQSSQMQSVQAAFEAAKNFAANPEGWLTLFSDSTGVGKTHLAVAVAGEQLKAGGSVFFAFVPELLDYLRYTFTPESTIRYDRLFDEVKNTPLLILDDLGHEHSSPWAQEKLYQIVVHRHNNRLPMLITSSRNFTEDKGPISSRVQDASTGIIVRIDADDYRKRGRRA
jgi:DNA replication protein DnaC